MYIKKMDVHQKNGCTSKKWMYICKTKEMYMHTIRIVSTVIMAMVLMASCDPPVSKPATTTTADDATTTTATNTPSAANTGTVVPENPQSVPPTDQPVQPADPALRAASVTAAKAVQTKVDAIKSSVDNAETNYKSNNLGRLNAVRYGSPRKRIIQAKTDLGWAKADLEDSTATGLRMLSQKAVEAAKALRSSAAADEAVAKAEAVKTAANKATSPSAQFEINAAITEIVTDINLTEETRREDLAAITAAKTQVDELKKLADAAVAAATAVQ